MSDEPQYADPERYVELAGFGGEWRDLFWNADFLALMAHRWGLDDVRTAVDVGCGAGHWGRTVLRLLPAAARVIGVDREPTFLEMARQQGIAAGFGDRMTYREGLAESLPFDDASVDLVTCQTVMIHVADASIAIREMLRILRPGGLIILAEPDNRAGNLALLNSHPSLASNEIADIVRFQLVVEDGKLAMGEGNNSIGGMLPGLLNAAGASDIRVHANDRCVTLMPPYDTPSMRTALDQELAWAREDISILFGTESDTRRHYLAGGGTSDEFDRVWSLVRQTLRDLENGIEQRTYHAARGFVMYLVSGRAAGSSPN